MKHLLYFITILSSLSTFAQWNGATSPTYPELIEFYKKLDREHEEIELYAMGGSDTEWPIYVCIVNGAQDSLKTFEKARKNTTVLINNAIHAGEPDGVNACLIWLDNWIENGKKTKDLPVIAIIPAYNVGGMLNRSATSRANQNGPETYGFRGNAENLDLNRDFIKMDSRNACTFVKLYHALDPDVFVDTHVSNGADYQYTLTVISSMKERLSPALRTLTTERCLPELTRQLAKKQVDLFTYVELKGATPEQGIIAFNDLPRYAMGYASLFHSLSFTVETHMLKPFPKRVEATLSFLENLLFWTSKNAQELESARSRSIEWAAEQNHYRFGYEIADKADSLLFKGFKAVYKTSEVTGLQRLSYDRSQPYKKYVPYFNTYSAKDSIGVPTAYIVNRAAEDVIERLKINGVTYQTVQSDSTMTVATMRITEYETTKNPYEGHYLHTKTKLVETPETITVPKGSLWIPARQEKSLFVLSVLEPAAEDSYFAWNFFDSYLQQKEHFSSYVFEDIAAKLLEKDPELSKALNEKKKTDPAFASDAYSQLDFIYRNSPYFERSTLNKLPVYKIY